MNRAWILRGALFVCALGLLTGSASGWQYTLPDPQMQADDAPHREEWDHNMPLYGNVAKVVITKYTYSENKNGKYVKSTSGEKRTYRFNKDGNVTSSISPTYSKKIEYDKNGRKICLSQHGKYIGIDGTHRIKYLYNNEGRIVEKVRYDGYNRKINSDFYKYDSNGNIIDEGVKGYKDSTYNTLKTRYRYDTQNRLIEQWTYWRGDLVTHLEFEYDGNKRTALHHWDGIAESSTTTLYKYDNAGRKIKELSYLDNDKKQTATLIRKQTYKYDTQGNAIEVIDRRLMKPASLPPRWVVRIYKYKYDANGNRIEFSVYWEDMTPIEVTEYTIEYRE